MPSIRDSKVMSVIKYRTGQLATLEEKRMRYVQTILNHTFCFKAKVVLVYIIPHLWCMLAQQYYTRTRRITRPSLTMRKTFAIRPLSPFSFSHQDLERTSAGSPRLSSLWSPAQGRSCTRCPPNTLLHTAKRCHWKVENVAWEKEIQTSILEYIRRRK